MNTNNLTKENIINNIDFKELAKTHKTQDDLASLTKQFMKNLIENMFQTELEDQCMQEE